MQMQNVKTAVTHPFSGGMAGVEEIAQMRPRSVVRDGERGVVRMDILGHVRGSPAWCEHLDLVPAPTQLAGEIANMVLHTARRLERVWADDAYT